MAMHPTGPGCSRIALSLFFLASAASTASPQVRSLPHRALVPLRRRHFRVQHPVLFCKRFKPGQEIINQLDNVAVLIHAVKQVK
jgi:hypothetical protein